MAPASSRSPGIQQYGVRLPEKQITHPADLEFGKVRTWQLGGGHFLRIRRSVCISERSDTESGEDYVEEIEAAHRED